MPTWNLQREAHGIVANYKSTGLTLEHHPVGLVRPALTTRRFPPADVLNTFADGQFARGCEIVTVRQEPETAKGVVFLTMKDETGNVNVIVWSALLKTRRGKYWVRHCWTCTASGKPKMT